jgi:hypothetical protein
MNNRAIPIEISSAINSTVEQSLAEVEQQMLETCNRAMQAIELKVFAELYAITVPTKKRKETTQAVRRYREEQWKTALKKADGNEKKAAEIIFKQGD